MLPVGISSRSGFSSSEPIGSTADDNAYQGTGNIVTFAVDGDTGKLTPTGAKVDVPRPVCVQFAAI